METIKWMEKRYNSILLSVIAMLLSLITWGGNQMYEYQKKFNEDWANRIEQIDKKQIIIEYRLTQLEK